MSYFPIIVTVLQGQNCKILKKIKLVIADQGGKRVHYTYMSLLVLHCTSAKFLVRNRI